jgi:hypothetical protein
MYSASRFVGCMCDFCMVLVSSVAMAFIQSRASVLYPLSVGLWMNFIRIT